MYKTYISTILFITLFAIYPVSCRLVSVSFGLKQICPFNSNPESMVQEERICTSMSALIHLQERDPYFSTTFIEYQDNNGNSIRLNESITIEASLKNSTIIFPLKFDKYIFNAYEERELGESCAIGFQVGSCSDPETMPPRSVYGSERFVLCCIHPSKSVHNNHIDKYFRDSGAYCLRYNYTEKYEKYDFLMQGIPAIENTVEVHVKTRGKIHTFNLNSFDPTQTINSFGSCNMAVNSQNRRFGAEEQMQSWYYLLRDTRREKQFPSDLKEIDRWYMVEKASQRYRKLGITPDQYKAEVKCTHPFHYVTQTHQIEENISDQFHEIRMNSLKSYLSENHITYEGETFVKQEKKSDELITSIHGVRSPDLVIINLLIYDVS